MAYKVITVTTNKGGVGKTTTAAIMAQAAAFQGYNVLVIDLDRQTNCSYALAAATVGTYNSYDLLQGAPVFDCIQTTTQGIDVVPASDDLATITSGTGSARRLERALKPIKEDYDYIIIDTPTTPELQYNALQVSSDLVIPSDADAYCIQSLQQIVGVCHQIQKSNPLLSFTGLLFSLHNGRPTLSRQLKDKIIEQAAALGVPYLGTVRYNITVREAAALQRSIYDYDKHSNGARDYLAIWERVKQEV